MRKSKGTTFGDFCKKIHVYDVKDKLEQTYEVRHKKGMVIKMNKYYPEGFLINDEDNKASLRSIRSLKEAMQRGRILEGKVLVCDSSHNLIIDIKGVRAFIPRDEGAIGIKEGEIKDIALITKVNKAVCFKILNIIEGENEVPTVILSRKEAQKDCMNNYINAMKKGDVIRATVTHLEQFGCFVDIGCGISSLIPIDLISISRISHPRDRFCVGDEIFAVVKDLYDSKVFLSHKELLGTWEENAEFFSVGETVTGIVRSIESYGIFIELAPNLAGLAELKENVSVGQKASVYIKAIVPEKMKVKLVIVDVFEKENKKDKFEYFNIDENIKEWQYSPKNSLKEIKSVFFD